MAQKNSTIIAKAWLEGTNDFQQRVPNPTQHGIRKTIDFLMDPYNRNYWNEFVNTLFNKIGYSYVHSTQFDNPLGVFKKGFLRWGNTAEEIAVNYLRDQGYTDDSQELLKVHRPEAQVWYHSINRQAKYVISINEDELRQAFTGDEEGYGLNQFVAACLQAPKNSDEYDEFVSMKQLMAEYDANWGFYRQNVAAAPDDEATSKAVLRAIRTMKGKLQFPSSLYNADVIDIPVHARPEDLVLFLTPEVEAALDVEALAMVFNLDKAEAQVRTIVIDEFPFGNDAETPVALLTTKDFYFCMDALYETRSFNNPDTLTTTYWLHHWSELGVSPFAPAILFTTGTGTTRPTIKQTVTSLNMAAGSNTVEMGGTVNLTLTLNGTITPTGETSIEVAPDAATFDLSAKRTINAGEDDETTEGVQLNARTYVDRLGVLHVQKSGLKAGDVITVTASSTYLNPGAAYGGNTAYTATTDITVK